MFTKDTRTETFLTQMGVEFTYTNRVIFKELSPGWNANNLGRPVPLREEAIVEYASLMESGSPAPATILHRVNGVYNVLDGVQRLSAAELQGFTELSAYIVTCDSENLLAAIRVLANARLQGHPEPPEWTRKHAVEILVIQRGLSTDEVAKMGGWSPASVSRTARILRHGFAIRCIGGPNLPDNLVDTISQHVSEDKLKVAAQPIATFFDTIKRAQLSHDDAEPFIAEFFTPLRPADSAHDIYVNRLQEFVAEPEIQTRLLGRRGPKLTRDMALRKSLKSAVTILEEIAEHGDELLYADEFFKLTKSINEKLRSISGRHPKPQTANTPADRWADAQN